MKSSSALAIYSILLLIVFFIDLPDDLWEQRFWIFFIFFAISMALICKTIEKK